MRPPTKQTAEWTCDGCLFFSRLWNNHPVSLVSIQSLMKLQKAHARRHAGIPFTPVFLGCELALNPPILHTNGCIIC